MNSISFYPLIIPFKETFSHHSKQRDATETIIVEISNVKRNIKGFGEGCPRYYVTGESIESAMIFMKENKVNLEQVKNVKDLKDYIVSNKIKIDLNPAAFCAVEIAFLDLFAKECNQSVEELLSLNFRNDFKKYTAILGFSSSFKFLRRSLLFKCAGFDDCKVKVSGNFANDKMALRFANFFFKTTRIDGNNLFKDSESAIHYLSNFKDMFWGIEEPTIPYDYVELMKIGDTLDKKIILDESFLKYEDIYKIESRYDLFIPNIRISKHGGILRTIEIIKELEQKKIKWILGTHVGEISLLTRASFVVLAFSNENLLKKEGGFSSRLLTFDPFIPNLKLNIGAKINNRSYGKIGFGLDYNYTKE